MTAPSKGLFKPPYPKEVVDTVRKLALRNRKYTDIANEVKRIHKLPSFKKSNVASMISRMRNRGEIELSKKSGPRPKIASSAEYRPAPITLAPLPRSRFT